MTTREELDQLTRLCAETKTGWIEQFYMQEIVRCFTAMGIVKELSR